MGEVPVVCVTNYKTMIESFQKDAEAYSGRFIFHEFDKIIKGGTYGLIFTDGELWREQRRFVIQILREFGIGKNIMQEKVKYLLYINLFL